MPDWYPKKDADKVVFLTNFTANIANATAQLNLSANTFGETTSAAQAWLDNYASRERAQKILDTALDILYRQDAATEKKMRAAAKQIKGMMDVPADVLNLLELVSTGDAPQTRAAGQMPVLGASAARGQVAVKFRKMGHQGVCVYSRRASEAAFSVLGHFSSSPARDERPNLLPGQPEHRDYYAFYIDRDVCVNEQSATVGVVMGAVPM